MIEEQENQNPNEAQDLADVIRQNLNFQLDQSVKRTLLKESLLKISLDKDFEHIFEQHNRIQSSHQEEVCQFKPSLLSVSQEIKEICSWLEDTQDFSGLAYLPFQSLPRLVHILHQKIEGTAIVITEYPSFWVAKMQEIGRLAKLKWGVLTSTQQSQDKVKVLQLYELKKLKILFITPSLFRCQQYHQFECDLLLVPDMHLYHHHSPLLSKIIAKTNPNRFLGIYHTLMAQNYRQMSKQLKMVDVNKPKSQGHNLIVLKTSQQDKFKTMMNYLSKSEHRRVLILVNKKQQAYNLNKKLMMESKTSISIYDYLTHSQLNAFLTQEMLSKTESDKPEDRIFEVIRRIGNCQITISKITDFLRFGNFDIAIYYSFTDVTKLVQSCFTVKDKLLLFSQNDYHNQRNLITSEMVTPEYLQKVVMKMVQKPLKKEEQSKKRSYSDFIGDQLMNSYTISKQYAQKDEEKVLKTNSFCRQHEISSKLFGKIIEALENTSVIASNYRTLYEIEIDSDSVHRLKNSFPMIQEVRRKINLLNVSTSLQKTIRSILQDFKREGIRYKITQQALQIKILKNYEDIEWEIVHKMVNQPVISQAKTLDKSLDTFRDCAYSSIQLTRREKALQKKEVLLAFLRNEPKESTLNLMDSYHKSNLLTSQIEEWIRHRQEVNLTDHELVIMLQGVERGKGGRFKEDPIYGRYRRLKYEELMEAVGRIYGNKRIKLE